MGDVAITSFYIINERRVASRIANGGVVGNYHQILIVTVGITYSLWHGPHKLIMTIRIDMRSFHTRQSD
jgi:hypothetical protein